ncbi:unnamed protein product [Acanthoscelides obtectus]|nr:unnamed protein product [Acanthoscelides obtectus]CAK1640995.1 Chorion peroxidase [Acanthoscelides obtectus]
MTRPHIWLLLFLTKYARLEPNTPPKECLNRGNCTLPIWCPAHVYFKESEKEHCMINGVRKGICCNTGRNFMPRTNSGSARHSPESLLDSKTISAISRQSAHSLAELRSNEHQLHKLAVLPESSPDFGLFTNSRTYDVAELAKVQNLADQARRLALASNAFKRRRSLTDDQFERESFDIDSTPLSEDCLPEPDCVEIVGVYRTSDGSCNNQLHPTWGQALTANLKLLPPAYEDHIFEARKFSVTGQLLPSARTISSRLMKNKDVFNSNFTLLLAQFGQFIGHDVSQSVDHSFRNSSGISCCMDSGDHWPERLRHFACLPIDVSPSDGFYGRHFGRRCMHFMRSVFAPDHECRLGYASQLDKVTHFIDASTVYGSSVEQQGDLRAFENGQLKVFRDFGRNLLPLDEDSNACISRKGGSACFKSGDTRVNSLITLTAVHTLFHREHNRVAQALSEMNPHWIDETVFQEARKIVIAELQTVLYNEFLPIVVGTEAIDLYDLRLQEGPIYAIDYDPIMEPSVSSEFTAGAFRFGHSLIETTITLLKGGRVDQVLAFVPETMNYPSQMRRIDVFDMILIALITQPVQQVDENFNENLQKYVFRFGNCFGTDLISINIQRGRDHGIQPYNRYRELLGLPKFTSFSDFGPKYAKTLATIYPSVDDVDLYVGGLLEQKAPGALVGRVFQHIIADQFARLKRGDRYFFENHPRINPSYFEPAQLAEIRKTSMARIVCDNADGLSLGMVQPEVFKVPSTW